MGSKIFFAIDIGNSSVDMAVIANGSIARRIKIPVEKIARLSRICHAPHGKQPSCAFIASVNPPAEKKLAALLRRRLKIKTFSIGKDIKVPIKTSLDRPDKVGVDRLLNGLAAYRLCRKTTAVVSFGTALTIDVVDKKGAFLGGVIAPGVSTAAKALHLNCALLPEVSVKPPKTAIGKNTSHAISAGITLGYAGLVRYILQKIQKETGQKPFVVLTGGEARLFMRLLEFDAFDPDLTLKGIILAVKEGTKLLCC